MKDNKNNNKKIQTKGLIHSLRRWDSKRYNVPYKIRREIADKFFDYLFEIMLQGHKIKLPKRLGYLYIVGRKKNVYIKGDNVFSKMINWKETNKLWAEKPETKEQKLFVYYDNYHSSGFSYSLQWDKEKCLITNKIFYKAFLMPKRRKQLCDYLHNNKASFITKEPKSKKEYETI